MSGRKKEERYATPVNHESLPHFDPRPAARVAASILRKVGAPHAIIGRVAMWTYLPPEHAAEIGIRNTECVSVTTPRGSVRTKALVTRRIRAFTIHARTIHHADLPWHWGYKGISTGDVVNDLSVLIGVHNDTIHQAKVCVYRVENCI